MGIKFAVSTLFKSKGDQVNKNFDKMGKNAKRFGKDSSKAFKKASKSALSFKSITGGILTAGAISKSFGLLSRGVSAVATEFLGFDQAVTAASAKFKGLDLTTKAGQKTLEELRKTARKVGAETEFNAKQAAQGLDFLALAGFNASQAMVLLPGVTNLATVANVDLATATDIASDSLGAFGLMTKDTDQLTKNFTRTQDVLAKTTASSNTDLVTLFEAVKKGGPSFTAAGQSMETFSALAGIMANSGVKGAEAGTSLRNVMLRLAKPTKESQDALDALGVTTRDSKGNFKDAVDILADLEKGLIGKGTAEKTAALTTIFGARAVTGVNILLKEGTESLRTYRQSLIDSTGSAEKMAEIMRGSLTNQLASLKSAAIEVGFQLFEAFSGEGSSAITSLTETIRGIDMTPVIEGLKLVIEKGKMIFETLEKAGVLDLLSAAFTTLISVIKLMWKIAEPIFKLMWKLLEPIVKGLTIVIKGVGVVAEALGGDTAQKGGQDFKVPNLATAGRAPQAPQRQPPNRSRLSTAQQFQAALSVNFANAPDGMTAQAESGSDIDMNLMGIP